MHFSILNHKPKGNMLLLGPHSELVPSGSDASLVSLMVALLLTKGHGDNHDQAEHDQHKQVYPQHTVLESLTLGSQTKTTVS